MTKRRLLRNVVAFALSFAMVFSVNINSYADETVDVSNADEVFVYDTESDTEETDTDMAIDDVVLGDEEATDAEVVTDIEEVTDVDVVSDSDEFTDEVTDAEDIAEDVVTVFEDGVEWIEVRTAMDLYNIRNNMSANYKLMNDIDLTEYVKEGGLLDFMGNGWNPIGSNDTYGYDAFTGVFDGCGHTIKGLNINVKNPPAGMGVNLVFEKNERKYAYYGLFSYNEGVIKNLSVVVDYKCSVKRGIICGGIVGCNKGTISNCKTFGIINASSGLCLEDDYDYLRGYYGGICGFYGYPGTINNCGNYAKIEARVESNYPSNDSLLFIGGIIGYAYNNNRNLTISSCYNVGDIKLSRLLGCKQYRFMQYIGGISGCYGKVMDCYNTGNISCITEKGSNYLDYYSNCILCGTGYGCENTNCYNIGNISINNASNSDSCFDISGNVCTNCYYHESVGLGKNKTGVTSLSESQMMDASSFDGFDFENVWTIIPYSSYKYPVLINNEPDECAIDNVEFVSKPDKIVYEKYDYEINPEGCKLKVYFRDGSENVFDVTKDMLLNYDLNSTGIKTINIAFRGYNFSFDVEVKDKEKIVKDGKEWYVVRTAKQLVDINYDLNANYMLMNDIDLTEYVKEGGIYDYMGNGWNPIGSGDIYGGDAFSGIFDGCGYTIKGVNMNIKNTSYSWGSRDPQTGVKYEYYGLFANVSGIVKNLSVNVDISNLECSQKFRNFAIRCGGIAAFCANGACIENCTTYGQINCKASVSYTGVPDSSIWVRILNIGGIVGDSDSGRIEGCANYVNIGFSTGDLYYESSTLIHETENYHIGGIVGYSTDSFVGLCQNAGNIIDERKVRKNKIDEIDEIIKVQIYVSAIASGGYRTQVENCYNRGNIYTESIYVRHANYIKAKVDIDEKNSWISVRGISLFHPVNSYNVGEVTGSGSDIYSVASSGTNCYCKSQSDNKNITGIEKLSDEQMQDASFFKGFDFDNIWSVPDQYSNYKYPVLKNNMPTEYILDKVEFINRPDKNLYFLGEDELELSGGKLRLSYHDGLVKDIDITENMVSGYDLSKVGRQTIKVVFRGYEFEFDIDVVDRGNIIGLELISEPNVKEFLIDTEFDFTGCQVCVKYSNDKYSYIIDIDSTMTTGGDITKLGTYTISYEKDGYSVTFDVKVEPVKTIGIVVDPTRSKLVYAEEEKIIKSDFKVLLTKNDGTEIYALESEFDVIGNTDTAGKKLVKIVSTTDESIFGTIEITVNHNFDSCKVTRPAATDNDGTNTYICSSCKDTRDETIYAASVVTLDNIAYEYDGVEKKPKVTVKDRSGNIVTSDNYEVTYTNNKMPGEAKAIVTFKNMYSGTRTLTFTIGPSKMNKPNVSFMTDGLSVTWKTDSNATGYEIYRSENGSGFSMLANITSWTTGEYHDKDVVKGRQYIYRIKAYKTVAGKKYYGEYSDKTSFFYKTYIKGICQIPYDGPGGGYLIGFESFDNPNGEYQYEMLILDCTLLAEGKPAWIMSSGKLKPGGNCLWTVWQPQYGYFWTLFRLYDKDGNMLEEVCYGFANVC